MTITRAKKLIRNIIINSDYDDDEKIEAIQNFKKTNKPETLQNLLLELTGSIYYIY